MPCMDCGIPTGGASRCEDHAPAAETARKRRYGSAHQRGLGAAHRAVRAQVLAEETHCALCHEAVDLELPGTHPRGPTAHHLVRRRHGGEAVRDNYALAHNDCNARAG